MRSIASGSPEHAPQPAHGRNAITEATPPIAASVSAAAHRQYRRSRTSQVPTQPPIAAASAAARSQCSHDTAPVQLSDEVEAAEAAPTGELGGGGGGSLLIHSVDLLC